MDFSATWGNNNFGAILEVDRIHSIHGTRAYADMLARVSYLALRSLQMDHVKEMARWHMHPGCDIIIMMGMYMDPS